MLVLILKDVDNRVEKMGQMVVIYHSSIVRKHVENGAEYLLAAGHLRLLSVCFCRLLHRSFIRRQPQQQTQLIEHSLNRHSPISVKVALNTLSQFYQGLVCHIFVAEHHGLAQQPIVDQLGLLTEHLFDVGFVLFVGLAAVHEVSLEKLGVGFEF